MEIKISSEIGEKFKTMGILICNEYITELLEKTLLRMKEGQVLCDKLASSFKKLVEEIKNAEIDMNIDEKDMETLERIEEDYGFRYELYLNEHHSMEIVKGYSTKYVIQYLGYRRDF